MVEVNLQHGYVLQLEHGERRGVARWHVTRAGIVVLHHPGGAAAVALRPDETTQAHANRAVRDVLARDG